MGEYVLFVPNATARSWDRVPGGMAAVADGEYVEHSDYARLERERDHYKAFHDETMPVLEAAQGLRNRLDAAERAMAAQAAR